MIDFRYHLVSLISVFLALAVGVVLGAGPLQNSLGTALNDQVSSLRADRNDLQSRLEQTEAAVNDRDDYITSAADSLLPGALDGRSVAVVLMPEAEGDDIDQVVTEIETAGATITGRVTLTSAWAETARESFRSTYSGQFGPYLDDVAADGNAVLGQGLATALTQEGEDATALMELLTASDTPLVTVDAQPSAPADMIVVIGPRTVAAADGSEPTAQATPEQDVAAWTSALTGAASTATTVVVGAGDAAADIVTALRNAEAPVTTVDSIGQATAAVSTPLALAATATGTVGSYGFDDGADAVIPPISR
ncbi:MULTISPECIES: copper transporter [Actinomyces]|uniref:Copper transporter mctb n=1 Tax=Actinomyces glycerinitolerans TaxID=1892869 RepID=A0A1M4S281_9ACTO|nr:MULTISPECIES: copper transporter [Actinomyces]RAX19077.1 copper transporter [Actinomyces sp. Z3]RAX19222.1 copper transporter [Actinomyces sp. Z5]SHE26333.1 copper transporter mctb [Actinomyces glycerinitolerans]